MSSNIYIEGEFHPRRICRMGDHNYTPLRICNKICKFNFPVACFFWYRTELIQRRPEDMYSGFQITLGRKQI